MKSNDLSKKFLFYITRNKLKSNEIQQAFSPGWSTKYIEVKSMAIGDLAGETFAVRLLFFLIQLIYSLFFPQSTQGTLLLI